MGGDAEICVDLLVRLALLQCVGILCSVSDPAPEGWVASRAFALRSFAFALRAEAVVPKGHPIKAGTNPQRG